MIRKVSKVRAQELLKYRKLRADYLKRHRTCDCCLEKGGMNLATDIHHTRGRIGKLLNMTDYWMAVCRPCHQWIGNNPGLARQLGWLCPQGKWNTLKN